MNIETGKDGDSYYALEGKDLQEGIAGFGNTEIEALINLMRQQSPICDDISDEVCYVETNTNARVFNKPAHNQISKEDEWLIKIKGMDEMITITQKQAKELIKKNGVDYIE